MTAAPRRGAVLVGSALLVAGLATACTGRSDEGTLGSEEADRVFSGTAPPALGATDGRATRSSLARPDHLGGYRVSDPTHGTEVTVTIEGGFRVIEANGVPDHETGLPGPASSPEPVAAGSVRYEFPAMPVTLGRAASVTVPAILPVVWAEAPVAIARATINPSAKRRLRRSLAGLE